MFTQPSEDRHGRPEIQQRCRVPLLVRDDRLDGQGHRLARNVALAFALNGTNDPSTEFRVLTMLNGNLSLQNISIEGGCADGGSLEDDGGVLNVGTLTVTNSTFDGNVAKDSGGAILNYPGKTIPAITSSTISNNTASDGGGIFNQGTITQISYSTFSGNTGTTLVGAIAVSGGTIFTIDNSTFSGNASGGSGVAGGIDVFGARTGA